jgi:hypothetical protein
MRAVDSGDVRGAGRRVGVLTREAGASRERVVSNSTFDRGSLSPGYIEPFDVSAKGETGDWLLR